MNAAARLVHQHALSRHLVIGYQLTARQFSMVFITFAIIATMLGIIYVTHVNRITYANYQRTLAEFNKLQAEQSQLLLERSTLMVPARIQHVAEKKMGMEIPDNESIVIIRE